MEKLIRLLIGYVDHDLDVFAERSDNLSAENGESLPQSQKGVDTKMKRHVYKRKDGRWQYSRQIDGKIYYAIATTYRELLLKIPLIKPRISAKEKESNITFVEYFEYFVENYIASKNVTDKYLEDWNAKIRLHIEPYFKKTLLKNLKAEDLQKFINGLPSGRNQDVLSERILRVLRKAYGTGRIDRNIALGIDKPTGIDSEIRFALTLKEQEKVLEKVKQSKIYPFYIFSLIVGSRRGETMKFNIADDLDEEKKIIHVRGTKTKNAKRDVYVTETFIKFLKENLPEGKFTYSPEFYSDKLAEIFTELGIENCLHGLRHTCSANLFFLGASDKYRQMQLGHASIVTTNNIYTNIKEFIPKASLRELYGDLYPNFD